MKEKGDYKVKMPKLHLAMTFAFFSDRILKARQIGIVLFLYSTGLFQRKGKVMEVNRTQFLDQPGN